LVIKTLFKQGPSLNARFLLFLVSSIVLMTVDHRYQHLDTLRSGLSVIVEPLRQTINLPFMVADELGENLSTHSTLLNENESLRTQNLLLKAQLQKYASLETENMRLRELLESSFKVGERVLIAELLRVDLDPFTRQIMINKGDNDDVFVGQPLIDADGIIGQIIRTSPFSSTAMLITDPSHALPVQSNRSGQRAIAIGTGRADELELLYIPNNAEIEVDDLLVSSGLGGRFPPGYPVARVTHIDRDPARPYLGVVAAPIAALQRSREVLLVWTEKEAVDGNP
jgi:rod shape-determining protein MreC